MADNELHMDYPAGKGWVIPDSGDHPLSRLANSRLEEFEILPLLGPTNSYGARYFRILLRNNSNEISRTPVIAGLFNQGSYPAYNWIEVSYLAQNIAFQSTGEAPVYSLPDTSVEILLRLLVELIPPGGHMMVEYDSQAQQETARALELIIPPVATPLGFLLFSSGCRAGFKDWYISEGGSEGPRKLQAYKALNQEHQKAKTELMLDELNRFLNDARIDFTRELMAAARIRAIKVIGVLQPA